MQPRRTRLAPGEQVPAAASRVVARAGWLAPNSSAASANVGSPDGWSSQVTAIPIVANASGPLERRPATTTKAKREQQTDDAEADGDLQHDVVGVEPALDEIVLHVRADEGRFEVLLHSRTEPAEPMSR